MKWSIAGLLSLGLLAALAAFFLVLSLGDGSKSSGGLDLSRQPSEPRQVDIVVADRDVEALARLSPDDVRVEKVDLDQAEDLLRKGAFRDPLQIAGRVTSVPISKGQLIVPEMFAGRASGLLITSALTEGKRAVSLSLSDTMGIEGVLYPGCTVDVMASMKVPTGEQGDVEPVSMTLLQGAYVLAVGDRTVVSPEGSEDPKSSTAVTGRARPSVTLLVAPDEAELLKLAMSEGSVSLVLRDPRDKDVAASDASTRLADLSPTLAAFRDRQRKRQAEDEADRQEQREIDALRRERERLEAEQALEELTAPPWTAEVIRGTSSESKTFANPNKKGGS